MVFFNAPKSYFSVNKKNLDNCPIDNETKVNVENKHPLTEEEDFGLNFDFMDEEEDYVFGSDDEYDSYNLVNQHLTNPKPNPYYKKEKDSTNFKEIKYPKNDQTKFNHDFYNKKINDNPIDFNKNFQNNYNKLPKHDDIDYDSDFYDNIVKNNSVDFNTVKKYENIGFNPELSGDIPSDNKSKLNNEAKNSSIASKQVMSDGLHINDNATKKLSSDVDIDRERYDRLKKLLLSKIHKNTDKNTKQQEKKGLPDIKNYKKNIDSVAGTDERFSEFYNNDLNKNFFEKDPISSFKNNIENTSENVNSDVDLKKDKIYSPIVDFASYFPESCQRDVESFYIDKDKFFEADKKITNEDLKEIVEKHPYLESLDISNCDNIDDFTVLNRLENLRELSVNNCDYFTNLDDISGCHNLRVLNIGNTFIKNLYTLKNFPNLEILNCACNSISDVNGIENCPKLTDVILWNCFSLNDISALDSLSNLKFLDIDSTSVSDILALSDCYNLEFLFMDNCNKVDDIFSLSVLTKLRCLLLDGKNILMPEQVMALKNLTNLECLTLSGRRIVDVEPFRKMIKMKELTLSGCNVTDLSPLENLTEIRKLDLTANSNLRDLSPLANMNEIAKLIVGGGGSVAKNKGAISSMNISDISVVRNFTKLTEIDLNTNPKLRDITPLEVCKDMEEINLSKCMQLEDVSVLGKLSKITKLNLTSCPKIKDLYCLRNLAELLELQYNGTIVHTPGLLSVLKKCKSIYLLKGNDADILSQTMLVSGKKKAKLTKTFGKYFKNKK